LISVRLGVNPACSYKQVERDRAEPEERERERRRVHVSQAEEERSLSLLPSGPPWIPQTQVSAAASSSRPLSLSPRCFLCLFSPGTGRPVDARVRAAAAVG
jgi:hypothetical protein